MAVMGHDLVPASRDAVADLERTAATERLGELFGCGQVSLEEFHQVLERIFTSLHRADLEAVMRTLPPPVHITPVSRRLTEPLVVQLAHGGACLGAGWQLGAATSVTTGSGTTRLDLNAASWDALEVDLRLETWGSIDILVPRGVAVQMVGGSGQVRIHSLSPPIPGGPVLRIRISGPAGAISVRHDDERIGERLPRRKRHGTVGRP
jgi:DUF1707 SHOCT-like domain